MGYYDKDQSTGGVTLKIPTGVVRKAVIEIEETVTGEPGTGALVENLGSSTEARLRFTIPQGAKGEQGDKGETGEKGETGATGQDGVSPAVTLTKTGKVTTMEVTDASGTHTAEINDGADGQDGQNGEDGFSPTAEVSKTGTTTTITVTDKNGTTSAAVTDGADGNDGQDGQDGVSPTVTISKAGTITTITITDATGPHTATIEDGDDYVLTAADKSDIADIVVQEIGSADTTAY